MVYFTFLKFTDYYQTKLFEEKEDRSLLKINFCQKLKISIIILLNSNNIRYQITLFSTR